MGCLTEPFAFWYSSAWGFFHEDALHRVGICWRGIPYSILDPHVQITRLICSLGSQGFNGRLDRLETSIERARIYCVWFRVEGRAGDVRGELVRLAHAVRGQAWVDWVAGGCWDGGSVDACSGVYGVI